MSGHLNDLYKLKNGDASRAGEVLADAFQHDPVWNKVFEGIPTARQRFAFETPVRYALKYGKVYAPSENLEGVAAWVSGGVAEMTIWRMIRSGAIRAGIKMGAQLARNMEPVFRPLQRDRLRGHPRHQLPGGLLPVLAPAGGR